MITQNSKSSEESLKEKTFKMIQIFLCLYMPIRFLVEKYFCLLLRRMLKAMRTRNVKQKATTVLVLENCPSLMTQSQAEKRKIREIQSNIVFSKRHIKLRQVKDPFLARFLKNNLILIYHFQKLLQVLLYLILQKDNANVEKLIKIDNTLRLNN